MAGIPHKNKGRWDLSIRVPPKINFHISNVNESFCNIQAYLNMLLIYQYLQENAMQFNSGNKWYFENDKFQTNPF